MSFSKPQSWEMKLKATEIKDPKIMELMRGIREPDYFSRLEDLFLGSRHEFFMVPERYKDAALTLENPSESQKKLIRFFNALLTGEFCEEKNPLMPRTSIYIHGSVGRGKTHIVAAYANDISRMLDKETEKRRNRLRDLVTDHKQGCFIDEFLDGITEKLVELSERTKLPPNKLLFYRRDSSPDETSYYTKKIYGSSESSGSGYFDEDKYQKAMREFSEIEESFRELNEHFNRNLTPNAYLKFLIETKGSVLKEFLNKTAPFCASDLLFVDFERLFEIYNKNTLAVREIASAPILIIDDLHPKGEEVRAKVIQDIIEMRYNQEKCATIVTSNLSPENLVRIGNYDAKIGERLVSRCNEMFVTVEIDDTDDYRKVIAAKKRKDLGDFFN